MAKFLDRELGMHRQITRRDFLDGMAVGAAGLAAATALPGMTGTAAATPGNAHGHAAYPPRENGTVGQDTTARGVGHAVRDGSFQPGQVRETGETYDLVVVGGGLSGLAAAYFYRKAMGPRARILILEAQHDFGGHAARNEFQVRGRTMLSNGGTVNMDTPSTWTPAAHDLLTKDLGVDLKALEATILDDAYAPYKLTSSTFFNEERWGKDQLVVRKSGESTAAYAARLPMSERGRADLVRLYTTTEDFYPGLGDAQKKAILAKLPYERYLRDKVGLGDEAYDYVRRGTNSLWGVDADRVPAADCWATGQPGFGGLGLTDAPWPGAGKTPLMGLAATEDDGDFYFPDGNASLARMLVDRLVPDSFHGTGTRTRTHDWRSIVTAKARYDRLDREKSPTRIRLRSTAFDVRHDGTPSQARRVTVSYAHEGRSYRVTGRNVIMACWNSVASYVVQGLPAEQQAAMRYGVKVPLIYARVALRDWRPFAAAGVSRVSTPSMYWNSFGLSPVSRIGGYELPHDPAKPTVVTLSKTPCKPGLPIRAQYKAGRGQLMATAFEDFEREIRDAMLRSLGDHGFDPGRDIEAITVNRWAHGYAYEYTSLDDPSLYLPESERPYALARRPLGRIAIANSDAEAFGYTHAAWNQAYRAVQEIV
ncbi:NAD(P)-binding protein [Streptomyces sp. NPDC055749]